MAIKENQSQKRYYPLCDAGNPYKVSLVEITEAQYRALYPEIWATQKREQHHHRCMCPRKYLWKCDGSKQQSLIITEMEVNHMKKFCFDSGNNDTALIAILNAISHVSAKMARNMTILAQQRQSKKGEHHYEQNERYDYAFYGSGNKGIACGLNNMQKIRDGDPLGGKASAESDFAPDKNNDFLD